MNSIKLLIFFSLHLAIVLADTQNTYRPYRVNQNAGLRQAGSLGTAPVIAANPIQHTPQNLTIPGGRNIVPGPGDSVYPRGIVKPSPGAAQGAALAAEGHALVAAQAAGYAAGFDAGLAAARAIPAPSTLIAPQGPPEQAAPKLALAKVVPTAIASPKIKSVPGVLSASPNVASPPLPIPHEITPGVDVVPVEEPPVVVVSPAEENLISNEAIVIVEKK